jgi:hypothetical protein
MAYKGIMGRDTGTSMPIGITRVGITRVGVTCFPVAAGCSAVGIGRPSACIGRVISGEIERHPDYEGWKPRLIQRTVQTTMSQTQWQRYVRKWCKRYGEDIAEYARPSQRTTSG